MNSPLPYADLLRDASDRSIHYLESLSHRAAYPSGEAVRRLKELAAKLPSHPTDPFEVLRLLDEVGSPATVASAGGRYFGYVIGGSHPAALAANWLSSAWDQNAVFEATSPLGAFIEKVALEWILDVLALPPDWCGGFVTGTTMGHVAALAAARHSVLADVGWDVERRGLQGAPTVNVIVGAETHTTLFKALRIIGLGTEHVVTVPTDSQGRMIASKIPRLSGPVILCAQHGNVNSGAFDPLPEILEVARPAGAWVHVDAAFGLWVRAAPERAHLAPGLDQVDSCSADLHKWLNVPYDNGLVLVRASGRDSLRSAMAIDAAYLPDEKSRDPGRYTPESSRRARGVDVWATLLSLGRSGTADLVERTCRFARQFGDSIRAMGYEILNEVESNQVVVAFGNDAATRAVVAAIQSDGTCYCSGTTWHGRAAMRISVCSWATTQDDVERSLAAIERLAHLHAPPRDGVRA